MTKVSTPSRFPISQVLQAPKRFDLDRQYALDRSPNKVNFIFGAYRDHEGKPMVMSAVKKAELGLADHLDTGEDNHDYFGVEGVRNYARLTTELLLGRDHQVLREGRAVGYQTINGGMGLRQVLNVLKKISKAEKVFVSTPTWYSHDIIAEKAGFQVGRYRYYEPDLGPVLNIEGLLTDLEAAPTGSIVLLQPCGHNPTGIDPTKEEWKMIMDVMRRRDLFPLFDAPYQGMASGDLEEDAWPVRHFADNGFEMVAVQTFSKMFGLYGERTANIVTVLNDGSKLKSIRSMYFLEARAWYNATTGFSGKIVDYILSNADLKSEWEAELKAICERIIKLRRQLRERIEALNGKPGSWKHLTTQRGMYCMTGMKPDQCSFLATEKHLYICSTGRFNVSAIPDEFVDYVANSFYEAEKL